MADVKKYDILSAMLMHKSSEFIFKDLDDVLSTIVACHTRPKREDFQFGAYLLSLYLLRTCGVKIDTNFTDIQEVIPEIENYFKAVDELKTLVNATKRSHGVDSQELTDDELLRNMLIQLPGNKKHTA